MEVSMFSVLKPVVDIQHASQARHAQHIADKQPTTGGKSGIPSVSPSQRQ